PRVFTVRSSVARPPPSMVRPWMIVSPPYSAGSSASISPLGAVFELAASNVRHGAERVHGFRSSPTPDTHVRMSSAVAGLATNIQRTRRPKGRVNDADRIVIADFFLIRAEQC